MSFDPTWHEAMVAALRGDWSVFADTLSCGNELSPEAKRFLVWRWRINGRGAPKVPEEFQQLVSIARDESMWNAEMELRLSRATGSPFDIETRKAPPLDELVRKIAKREGVSAAALKRRVARKIY